MGIKERRTKILLSLFIIPQIIFDFLKYSDKIMQVFDLTFNQKTKGTISGMLKDGLIEKRTNKVAAAIQNVVEDSQKSSEMPKSETNNNEESTQNEYRLTKKGFYQLCLEFPFFRYLIDTWDGKWRILSYEIPEKKRDLRDKLRREVSGWGLGPWHRSFWLTPHPIIENLRQLISQKEEEKYVQAFESDHVFGNREILIEKVWQKSVIDKKYRDLFKRWHDILSKEGEKTDKFRIVISEYVTLLRIDPGLPTDLVGKNWISFEAFNIFKEIKGILLS